MILRSRKSVTCHRPERGYILITLILFVALIAIAAMVMAPVITFQVKRDREEELVHRGVQYSRAMKHFVKKFGRYPTRIEELENTNQVRFLRKRYKDPITGKDFRILHMGDVQISFGPGIAGATPVGGLSPGAAGIPGSPGAQAITNGANTLAIAGGLGAAGLNTAPGIGAPGVGASGVGTTAVTNGSGGQNADQNAGDDATEVTPNQGTNHAAPGAPGTFGAGNPGNGSPGAQVFGGGPIVGVASTSKDKTIRIFDKKDHYYQWQFIYDPTTDRGGLLTTPNQPSLQAATTAIQGAPGTPGAPGAPGGVSGQPGTGFQPVQPNQPGMQPPQMPPEQP